MGMSIDDARRELISGKSYTDNFAMALVVAIDTMHEYQKIQNILDKIRAEIEQLPTSTCTETRRIRIDADDFKGNVFEIFDKYKSEIEPQESEET